MIVAAVILALTYIGVIFTRLPHTNIDRPVAALGGAILMVLCGVLTFEQAVNAINFDTIILLLGMMLLLAALQQVDFFNILAAQGVRLVKAPWQLLLLVIFATGICSAFLVNDAVVLIFTPVIIYACRILKTNPVPYLIAEAMASNIGSTASIVGNPQNMLIGMTSGISFVDFMKYLAPVAIIGCFVLYGIIYLFYRREMRETFESDKLETHGFYVISGRPIVSQRKRLRLALAPILVLTIASMFFSHNLNIGLPLIALSGGVAAVLFSGIRPSKLFQQVDWALLLFFAGLFIVIDGARQSSLLNLATQYVSISPDAGGVTSLHAVSLVLSQIVSNVPLTMLLIPLLEPAHSDLLWLSLAAGSTLAGNATIIGAVANIIVVEQAHRHEVKIGWWEFSRVGLLVTLITMGISTGILILEHYLGIVR